jgi:hypothetical protein
MRQCYQTHTQQHISFNAPSRSQIPLSRLVGRAWDAASVPVGKADSRGYGTLPDKDWARSRGTTPPSAKPTAGGCGGSSPYNKGREQQREECRRHSNRLKPVRVRRRHRSASADGGTAWRASPQADGGTAWRSAAAHRHHTRLRIPKQVGKFGTRAQFSELPQRD